MQSLALNLNTYTQAPCMNESFISKNLICINHPYFHLMSQNLHPCYTVCGRTDSYNHADWWYLACNLIYMKVYAFFFFNRVENSTHDLSLLLIISLNCTNTISIWEALRWCRITRSPKQSLFTAFWHTLSMHCWVKKSSVLHHNICNSGTERAVVGSAEYVLKRLSVSQKALISDWWETKGDCDMLHKCPEKMQFPQLLTFLFHSMSRGAEHILPFLYSEPSLHVVSKILWWFCDLNHDLVTILRLAKL